MGPLRLSTLLLVTLFCFLIGFLQVNFSLNTQQESANSASLTDLERRADQGDARAQWILGNVYEVGSGVSYQRAALQGQAIAQKPRIPVRERACFATRPRHFTGISPQLRPVSRPLSATWRLCCSLTEGFARIASKRPSGFALPAPREFPKLKIS